MSTFEKLVYADPGMSLKEARRQGFSHQLGMPEGALPRGHESNPLIEHLDAAVFAYGLARLAPNVPVHFARHEAQDHDFVLRFLHDEQSFYCPLQLKELVPVEVNPRQQPAELVASLVKYGDAQDLEVAIKVSRDGFDPRALSIPRLHLGGLWFFGQLSANPRRWYLYGNCLESPHWFEFVQP